jgi:hypothetical protein
MKNKIKIYRMPLSRVFPATHPKAGQKTDFYPKMLTALTGSHLACECGWYGEHEELIPLFLDNGCASDGLPCYVDDSRCPVCYGEVSDYTPKLHTMRALNPESKSKTWSEKIKEVRNGEAVLVVYDWKGKPYSADGCRNLFIFGIRAVLVFVDKLLKSDKYKHAMPVIDSEIGVQKTLFVSELNCVSVGNTEQNSVTTVDYSTIARKDGLSLYDFKAWFNDCDLSKPFEIIHFAKFRY